MRVALVEQHKLRGHIIRVAEGADSYTVSLSKLPAFHLRTRYFPKSIVGRQIAYRNVQLLVRGLIHKTPYQHIIDYLEEGP